MQQQQQQQGVGFRKKLSVAPEGTTALCSMLDTQLCVPSKVIEQKIHQIRKAEDKVRKS